jgi:hypothetical protein
LVFYLTRSSGLPFFLLPTLVGVAGLCRRRVPMHLAGDFGLVGCGFYSPVVTRLNTNGTDTNAIIHTYTIPLPSPTFILDTVTFFQNESPSFYTLLIASWLPNVFWESTYFTLHIPYDVSLHCI